MSIAIKFENISKEYRLGLISTRTLSHDISRWWTINIRGKEDPYLKIGETNDRTRKGKSEFVWALKDINFEIEQGDVVGIIGKNGAGKSTLLKILSKVTTPTTGIIQAKGRIASLLEVGTGFHPQLTGRENIYMNGAILGMAKSEIASKLDEIVDFSGVERYIDTPVKRYSSGMTVRLGFAVAAHLEPEILIVDEVLAVGDAEFQKKAIGKMQDVSRGEGRTVLFVSHNMASVRLLCNRGILLSNGQIQYSGSISNVIDKYLADQTHASKSFINSITHIARYLTIDNITINEKQNSPVLITETNNVLNICVEGTTSMPQAIALELRVFDKNQNPLAFYSPCHYEGFTPVIQNGKFKIEKEIVFPKEIIKGTYYASLSLTDPGKEYHLKIENGIILEFEGFATKTSHVFSYNEGAGFLFLK